jgi:hypothetical protein
VSFFASRINTGDWGRAPTNDGPTPSLLASRRLHTETSFFIVPRIRDPMVQNKVRIVYFASVDSASGRTCCICSRFCRTRSICMDTYGRWRCVREMCHFLALFSGMCADRVGKNKESDTIIGSLNLRVSLPKGRRPRFVRIGQRDML